jgi:hypothetical protein
VGITSNSLICSDFYDIVQIEFLSLKLFAMVARGLEERKMNTTTNDELFSGEAGIFGGLSNEGRLVAICPEEFMKDRHSNPWCRATSQIFFEGGRIDYWKWKTADEEVRSKQMSCFSGLMGSFGIKHEHKQAISGWMLSEMLEEVPRHVPKEKTA